MPFAAAWHRSSLAAASNWTAGLAVSGLVLLVAALARPQRVEDKREVRSQGYDIVMAIDLSGSMLSEDYEKDGERINRLQAIKPVIQAFIERRPSDRIGVVLFSSKAYTLAPLMPVASGARIDSTFLDRAEYAFAHVVCHVAVAQLDGLVLAGRRARRDRGPAHRPPERVTSASTVGLPRESRISRALIETISVILLLSLAAVLSTAFGCATTRWRRRSFSLARRSTATAGPSGVPIVVISSTAGGFTYGF